MLIKTACGRCGETFEAGSYKARYCSAACRNKAYRARKRAAAVEVDQATKGETVNQPPADSGGSLTEATRVELAAAGRGSSAAGLAAVLLAQRIEGYSAAEPGASLASLVREHAAALTRALQGTAGGRDIGDELAKRRAERRRAAGLPD